MTVLTWRRLAGPFVIVALLWGAATVAQAESQGVIATVNDSPITAFDISQRIKLMEILGQNALGANARKAALQDLVDEVIKLAEAKKLAVAATDLQIDKQLDRMAQGLKTNAAGLKGKLEKQGVAVSSLRQFIAAQIGFNRILTGKYAVKADVSAGEIDNKLAEVEKNAGKRISEIMNDPRMRPVTVYAIQQIELPFDASGEAMNPQLIQARAVEAAQMMKRYTGCKSARAAAEGIFNVKIGKTIEADAAKLPKQLKAALEKAGPGKAIGPVRSKTGIQIIGFCDSRKLTPPRPKFEKPTRQQVEVMLANEKYAGAEERVMKELRLTAYVEYKDASSAQ